jgi:hypothetical protein
VTIFRRRAHRCSLSLCSAVSSPPIDPISPALRSSFSYSHFSSVHASSISVTRPLPGRFVNACTGLRARVVYSRRFPDWTPVIVSFEIAGKNFDRKVTPAKYCPPVSHYPFKIGSPQIESEFEVCHWSSQESESVNFQSALGAITAVANDKRIAIFAVVF